MSRSSRRGISIAIGALTVTMAMAMQTAPFVTNAPFAAVAMAQQTQAAATGAINSPAVSNTDVFTVNGSVREIREYGISASAIHNKNSRAIPGTKVYFQWKEGEHGQFTSPVYYAEADADGNFSIFAKPFFDSNGNIHTFDAKYALDAANADFTNEKVRIWSELPAASTENYRLSYAYGSSWSPAAGDNTSDGATWIEANKRLDDVKIQYTKRVAPGSMHLLDRSKWADENNQPAVTDLPNSPMSPGADSTQGLIGGLAYWNLNPAAAAANFAAYNDVAQTLQTLQPGDIPANGTMVVASYLSDKAVTAIEAHVATAFPGKTLRGADWTVDDEETLQDWIRTQVAADQSWIAETVFNNITGSTWHIRGKISNYWTRFTGIYDTTGELAPARNIGRFDGVKGAEGTKHINTDWLYVDFPDLPTDTGVLGGWSLPRYAPVNSEFSPNTSTLFASYPVNFGFIPLKLDFQVANYNSILGTAVPGDIAKTTGINVPIDGNITYKVEWLDGEGTPVAGAECAGLKPSAAGILPSCDFQVPPNLQKDTTYIAVLSTVDKNGNKVELTRDSFTALVPKSRPFAIGSVGTNYTDSATTATPSSVSAPLPNIADPVAAGVTYSIAEALPEGLTLNPQTGHIEGIPTTPGAHIFTVTQTVPNSAFGGKAEDTTQRKYVLSLDITQTILPAGVVGHEYKNADGSAVDVKKLIKGLPDSGITTATGEKVPVTVNVTAVENLPAGLSFDAATGTIVGTPTAEGTFKDPIVVYDITFPQGAVRPNITGHRDKTEIVVTPQPLTELADPSYASMDVPRGTTATTAPPTYVNPITNAETTAPAGTKYALGPGAPNGATIDENTGVVTYPVPIGIKFDTAIKIPVTVTYPDSTTDNPEVEIVAKASTADKLNPSIPAGTAKPGNNATTTPVLQTADGTNTPIPAGTQCSLGPNPPAGATIDATTCVVTMPIPADSTTGTAYNVPVVLTYPDGSSEAATAPFTTAPMDKEVFIPSYAPVDGKRGLPAEIPVTVVAPDGTPAVVPTGTVYSLGEGAPEGATIDPVTGKISMVVPLDADTNTLINVPVVVTYPDKSVNNVTAKLQPIFSEADVNDPTWTPVNAMPGEPVSLPLSATPLPQGTTGVVKDDQGNVIGKVLADGSLEVTVPGSAVPGVDFPLVVELVYPDGSVETVPAKVDVVAAPQWADASAKPGKDVVIPNTGGAIPANSVPTVTAGSATVRLDENGNIVVTPAADAVVGSVITVEIRDPKGRLLDTVSVTVLPLDNAVFAPNYVGTNVPRGTMGTLATPTFTNAAGDPTMAPEGTVYTLGPNAPEGAVIDAATGVVSYLVPVDSTLGTPIEIPVVATYPDGSSDEAMVPVTPVANNADTTTPTYEEGSAKPGQTAQIPAPTLSDENGPVDPAGTTFAVGPDAPADVTVDPNTGAITVLIPAGTPTGTKISVPVVVTYPDGTKETVTVVATAAPVEAELFIPAYAPLETPRGTTAITAAPVVKDAAGAVVTAPQGTVYKLGPDAPAGATIDPNTGVVTYPVPKDAEVGTPINIAVIATYPDASTNTATVEITPAISFTDALTPVYTEKSSKPGTTATVPAPVLNDALGNPAETPENTVFALGPNAPEGATIDPVTGEITMPIPMDSLTGTIYTVPVAVTYPDGSTDTVDVKVTTAPVDAQLVEPAYQPKDAPRGTSVTSDAPTFIDAMDAPITAPQGTVYKLGPDAPAGATIDPDTGVVTYLVPNDAPLDTPINIPVIVSYPDGSTDESKIVINPKASNADINEPSWTPVNAMPGEPVSLPLSATPLPQGTTGVVKDGMGNVIGKVLADGSLEVTVPGSAVPGVDFPLVVELVYPDGSVETVPAKVDVVAAPQWADTPAKPNETVTIPVTGGTVPAGAVAVVTAGVAEVTLDAAGNLVVTPSADSLPGSVIIVEIRDEKGRVIDTVTITIARPGPVKMDKCLATSLGIGLPLLFLAPLGLASQIHIPGVSDMQLRIQGQLNTLNNEVQRGLGIHNQELIDWFNELNATFNTPQVRRAAGAVGIVLAGLLIGGLLADACAPGGISSDKAGNDIPLSSGLSSERKPDNGAAAGGAGAAGATGAGSSADGAGATDAAAADAKAKADAEAAEALAKAEAEAIAGPDAADAGADGLDAVDGLNGLNGE